MSIPSPGKSIYIYTVYVCITQCLYDDWTMYILIQTYNYISNVFFIWKRSWNTLMGYREHTTTRYVKDTLDANADDWTFIFSCLPTNYTPLVTIGHKGTGSAVPWVSDTPPTGTRGWSRFGPLSWESSSCCEVQIGMLVARARVCDRILCQFNIARGSQWHSIMWSLVVINPLNFRQGY